MTIKSGFLLNLTNSSLSSRAFFLLCIAKNVKIYAVYVVDDYFAFYNSSIIVLTCFNFIMFSSIAEKTNTMICD